MQYRTAEMYLCQAASFWRAGQPQLDAAVRAELLGTGLAAAKSLLDYYLALPVYADMALNNSEWIQISFAVTVASRLLAMGAATSPSPNTQPQDNNNNNHNDDDSGGGNRNHRQRPQPMTMTRALRQQSLDLANAIRHLALRVGALVTQQVDAQGGRDIFHHYEQRVRRMQVWYEQCCGGNGPEVAGIFARKSAATSTSQTEAQQSQQQQQQQPTPIPCSSSTIPTPALPSPFTLDGALGLLPPPGTTSVNLYAPDPTSYFSSQGHHQQQHYVPRHLPPLGGGDPCAWSTDSSQATTPDIKMAELFPELDYIFCDWLSPPIEV